MDDKAILNQLPIDRSVAYANDKGEQTDKAQKAQSKVPARLGPFVKKFLEPDEKILYATPAVAPMNALEQFLKGWHVYYLKSCALVFTSKRVLYIPTGMTGKPRQSLAQMRYGDIASYSLKGMLSTTFELAYKSGRKETFTIQTMGDRKKIGSFLPRLVPGGEGTDRRDRHFLCPRCAKPLAKDVYACPACRQAFKTPAQAVKFAMLVPGGGFFQTGHFWFGVQGALADVVALFILLGAVGMTMERPQEWPLFLLFVMIVGLNKLAAIQHVKFHVAQYIPVEK